MENEALQPLVTGIIALTEPVGNSALKDISCTGLLSPLRQIQIRVRYWPIPRGIGHLECADLRYPDSVENLRQIGAQCNSLPGEIMAIKVQSHRGQSARHSLRLLRALVLSDMLPGLPGPPANGGVHRFLCPITIARAAHRPELLEPGGAPAARTRAVKMGMTMAVDVDHESPSISAPTSFHCGAYCLGPWYLHHDAAAIGVGGSAVVAVRGAVPVARAGRQTQYPSP